MSRTCVCPTHLSIHGCFLLLFIALSSHLHSQVSTASSTSGTSSTSSTTRLQSDADAIQAMQNVLEQSGGAAAWKDLHSTKESFSVLNAGEKNPRVESLLDDWSLGTTRYRRKVEGQRSAPADHNGNSTFLVNKGFSQVAVPEFDQARTLVGRLPAAAVEVMLRRTEYVFKISKFPSCESENICIDVFRARNTVLTADPEQQWKIAKSTGLPVTVRYRLMNVGSSPTPVWQEVYFLKYATEDGLIVPTSIGIVIGRRQQVWTFVSIKKNPEFDTTKFDEEAAQ